MEGVVVSSLSFANRALILFIGIGLLAISLISVRFKSQWQEITRGAGWSDPWADAALLSSEQPDPPERERQVA